MSVPDFATTVYNQIGITADKELMALVNDLLKSLNKAK